MKESLKEKIENLFDGDDTNSNNVIDRIGHQMTSPAVDKKIDELVKNINDNEKKND